MPEAAIGSPERVAANVVTGENRAEFMAHRLDLEAPPDDGADAQASEQATQGSGDADPLKTHLETQQTAEPKEGDKRGSEVFFEGKWVPKHNFGYRVHLKSQEGIKEAETRIRAETEAKIKAESEARTKAENEARELRERAAPLPPAEKVVQEPKRADFQDDEAYIDARVEWKSQQREEAQREEGARVREAETVRSHNARIAEYKKADPEYDAKIAKVASIIVPPEVRNALVRSEIGPELLVYLADNAAVAERFGRQAATESLYELGEISATLKAAKKATGATEGETAKPAKVIEISKAPAPATPLKLNGGGGAAVVDGDNLDFQAYKAGRKAGKIK